MTLEMELNLSLNKSSTLPLSLMAQSLLDQVVRPQDLEVKKALSLLDQVVRPQAFLIFLMVVLQSEVSSVKQVLPLEEVLSLQVAFKSINSVTSLALVSVVLVLPTLASSLINLATQSTPPLLLLLLAPPVSLMHSATQPLLVVDLVMDMDLVIMDLVNTTHTHGLRQNGDTRLQTHLTMNTSTLLPIT